MLDPLPIDKEWETKAVLRKAASAHRALAELKGVTGSIPSENILLETLALREARESSAIENIISTLDEVYRSNWSGNRFSTPEAKEVHQYARALIVGFGLIRQNGLLTLNHIVSIQGIVEQNDAGFRKLPGTRLMNDRTGEVVYTPPQDHETIVALMGNLERFINDDEMYEADPLVKMAVIHHRFESIHPFYDGNGRTGRIVNILYLVLKGLLGLPILYMSRFIIGRKSEYYRLLQEVREKDRWEEWILFMLEGVESTAKEAVVLIESIRALMQENKRLIRSSHPKMYSPELLNNLFRHPYTKIEYIQSDLQVSRNTAIRYLEQLVAEGILVKHRIGRENFYENRELFRLLSGG
jgi:Fic family protein